MKVLVFENNLIWSTRLVRSLQALGHEAQVHSALPEGGLSGNVALVNLGAQDLRALVGPLRASGIFVIGHAGHKEKDLHDLGREAGCDRLATNSEITYKLDQILSGVP